MTYIVSPLAGLGGAYHGGRPPTTSLKYIYTCSWLFSSGVFRPCQVFGPRPAKSQPIWIKFCRHLLYGIQLWVELDHNQNDFVFIILVTHPKSYIEKADHRDFGGKPSKWRGGRC